MFVGIRWLYGGRLPIRNDFLRDPTSWPVCLITDQNMPEMTGLELAAHLRSKGSVIPVLLFSGHLSASLISRAAELGIKVVGKPAPENELVSFVAGGGKAQH